jgi:adenylate kinase
MMVVVLFGPPAAGKGTQASRIGERLGVPQISTGDIFRKNLREGTELGQRAKAFMDRGELVPDEVVAEIVQDRLTREDCVSGALLDGFPRSVGQAGFLDGFLATKGESVSLVLNLQIPDAEVVRRMSGRRSCLSCGATYHVEVSPPRVEGVCDRCGAEVVQRGDDQESTVRNRLAGYHAQTSPVLDWYRGRGVVRDIDGIGSIEDVALRIADAITSANG